MTPDYKKRKTKYSPFFCDDLIKYMSQGKSNIECAAKFCVTEKTLYAWRKEHTDFEEAYHLGDPIRFAFLMEKADKIFLEDKNDKGYKHWLKKISFMYKNYSPEESKSSGTTNNIQIGNMSVLQNIGNDKNKLLEYIQSKLLSTHIIETEVIEIKELDHKDSE